jgi:type IV secretion system protein VirD4
MQGQGVLFGQVGVVFGIVVAGVWIATQWTAAALGYQLRLGSPWFDFFGTPVYHPWRLFEWWFLFDAYAPRVFDTGGAIAGGSGLVAVVVAIAMSVWRSRQSKLVTTYGSARWADAADIRKTGLTQPAGVFLGRHDDQYLRHEGPEHVLTFAPTRSGKGVGLVVPTLLSWPASAVIHDIKGENWQITAGWRSRFSHCLLFNPTDPKSAAYNPLLEVRRGAHEVRDVQNIADILVDPEGALERRNHWEKTSHALLVGAILHVLYAGTDKTLRGVANFLSDPACPFELTLHRMMTTKHLGDARQRAFRCAVHSHVVSRPVPRPDGGRGHVALRLAHRRSDRIRASRLAVLGRATIRHQPHEAAGPSDPQPDRSPPDRIA